MEKTKVGVLGATGMVGQMYITLLEHHPWFEVTYVAASPRSAGKRYSEAVSGRWHMRTSIPEKVQQLTVEDASNIEEALGKCGFVFSALAMEKLKELQGCEIHTTHMPTPGDEAGLRRLGVNLTSHPDFATKRLFLS